MQTKTSMRYHFTLSEWLSSIYQQTTSTDKDVKRAELLCFVAGNADRCNHYGKQYGGTQKIKNGSAFWPSNPTSGNISKRTENTSSREHKHPFVHCSIIYNQQGMEAAQVCISRWVDKTTMGRLHNGILPGHKTEENFTLCDSVDGPGEHYAKWNKPEKDKYHMISLTWNLTKKLN